LERKRQRGKKVEDDPYMWVPHVSGGKRKEWKLRRIRQGHFGLFSSQATLA
jgi:hypothetical protein